jgi:hypothetical protein
MIAHVVLFRPRSEIGAEERAALVRAFESALREIPSIRQARVGRRVAHGRPYGQAMTVDYEFAAVIEFDDLEGLKAYLEHPAHQRLAAEFFKAFEYALMYDYQWTTTASLLPSD